MGEHFASKKELDCRQAYALYLVAIITYKNEGLTDNQNIILLSILKSLGLPDIRAELLDKVNNINACDIDECEQVVVNNGLSNNLLFDSLVLCRCRGWISGAQIRLITELGGRFGLKAETVVGFPVLVGYLLGMHGRIEYASNEILELTHWHPLFVQNTNRKKLKNMGSGYFKKNRFCDVSLLNAEVIKTVIFRERAQGIEPIERDFVGKALALRSLAESIEGLNIFNGFKLGK